MKIYLDLDDFRTTTNNDLKLLDQLNDYFNNFKITLFTIISQTSKKTLDFCRERDYIQLAFHGITHEWSECLNWDYEHAKNTLLHTKETTPQIKSIMRAPRWQISTKTRQALNDLGWILADHPNLQGHNLLPKKRYFHNTDLTELNAEFLATNQKEVLKVHGHYRGEMPNDLHLCINNLYILPKDVKFLFISELWYYIEK